MKLFLRSCWTETVCCTLPTLRPAHRTPCENRHSYADKNDTWKCGNAIKQKNTVCRSDLSKIEWYEWKARVKKKSLRCYFISIFVFLSNRNVQCSTEATIQFHDTGLDMHRRWRCPSYFSYFMFNWCTLGTSNVNDDIRALAQYALK